MLDIIPLTSGVVLWKRLFVQTPRYIMSSERKVLVVKDS